VEYEAGTYYSGGTATFITENTCTDSRDPAKCNLRECEYSCDKGGGSSDWKSGFSVQSGATFTCSGQADKWEEDGTETVAYRCKDTNGDWIPSDDGHQMIIKVDTAEYERLVIASTTGCDPACTSDQGCFDGVCRDKIGFTPTCTYDGQSHDCETEIDCVGIDGTPQARTPDCDQFSPGIFYKEIGSSWYAAGSTNPGGWTDGNDIKCCVVASEPEITSAEFKGTGSAAKGICDIKGNLNICMGKDECLITLDNTAMHYIDCNSNQFSERIISTSCAVDNSVNLGCYEGFSLQYAAFSTITDGT
jgi:hypothetical protein